MSLRNGVVVKTDSIHKVGIIMDSNGQEIAFSFDQSNHLPVLGTQLSFEIQLLPERLTAIVQNCY